MSLCWSPSSPALLLLAGALDAALAQAGPFGAPRAQAPAASDGRRARLDLRQAGGVLPAVLEPHPRRQSRRQRRLEPVRLSFLYGIFHAAGPGHGKAVISSYMVANEETWRRGVVLSFASALLQALVAVVVVGIAAGAAQCDRGDHEQRGRCHRNRELLAHRPDRPAVVVGEGPAPSSRALQSASSARRRRCRCRRRRITRSRRSQHDITPS